MVLATGSPDNDYHGLEYKWAHIILCRGILPRKDMLVILKHFNMRFFGDNWEENISLDEIGRVILSDVMGGDLFPYLPNYLKENYPKIFTFEEAEKIYNTLMNINSKVDITKLWMSIERDSLYLEIAKDTLESLKKIDGNNKEISVNENKVGKDDYFRNIVEEILVSLYKLSMKSYK